LRGPTCACIVAVVDEVMIVCTSTSTSSSSSETSNKRGTWRPLTIAVLVIFRAAEVGRSATEGYHASSSALLSTRRHQCGNAGVVAQPEAWGPFQTDGIGRIGSVGSMWMPLLLLLWTSQRASQAETVVVLVLLLVLIVMSDERGVAAVARVAVTTAVCIAGGCAVFRRSM
jgi:hypothetical protein